MRGMKGMRGVRGSGGCRAEGLRYQEVRVAEMRGSRAGGDERLKGQRGMRG